MTLAIQSKNSAFSKPIPRAGGSTLLKKSTVGIKAIYAKVEKEAGPEKIFAQRIQEYGRQKPKLNAAGRPCAGVFGSVQELESAPHLVFKIQRPEDAAKSEIEKSGMKDGPEKTARIASRTIFRSQTALKELGTLEELRRCDVPHVPKLYDFIKLDRKMYVMVMENVGPNLADVYLSSKQKLATMDEIEKFGLHALETLVALHDDAEYAHFDLKPHNYSGDLNAASTFRTLDFGISDDVNTYGLANQYKHSLWYRAPESEFMIENETKSDIFALGCVLFELYTQSHLFRVDPDKNEKINMLHAYFDRLGIDFNRLPMNIQHMFALMRQPMKDRLLDSSGPVPVWRKGTLPKLRRFQDTLLAHRDYKNKIKFEPLTPRQEKRFNQFVELLEQMLKFNPDERITADQALASPFFTSADSSYLPIQILTRYPAENRVQYVDVQSIQPSKRILKQTLNGQPFEHAFHRRMRQNYKPPEFASHHKKIRILDAKGQLLVERSTLNYAYPTVHIPRTANPCTIELIEPHKPNATPKSWSQQIQSGSVFDMGSLEAPKPAPTLEDEKKSEGP